MMFAKRIRKSTGLGLCPFGLRVILMCVMMLSGWAALEAEAQSSRKTSSRRTSPSRTSRDKARKTKPSPTAGYTGERTMGAPNEIADEDNLDLPPEEREYQFSIMDGSYADLLDAFSRATGRGILGDPPAGKITFVSTEVMTYEDILNRIRKILFKHPDQYYLQLKGNEYEIVRFNELVRQMNEDRIFTTLVAFEAAGLGDEEAAMLYYTPEGSIADLEPIRDLMPDYFRAFQYGESNSMIIFGLVKDIKKYLNLIKIIGTGADDPRELRIFRLEKIGANQALTILKQMIPGFDPTGKARGGSKAPSPWGIDAFADEPMKRLIVKAVPSKINEIQELLPIIDVTIDERGTPVTIKLIHIRVSEFVNLIKPIMTGSENVRKTTRRRGSRSKKADAEATATTTEDMTLIPRPATNELIVVTTEEKLAKIREYQQLFDKPRSRPMEILDLEFGDAEEIIAKAEELITLEKAVSGDDSVLSLKEGLNNTIIVIGSGPDIENAKRIISDLDEEDPDGTPSLHRVRLTNIAPTKAVEMLKAIDSGAPPKASPTRVRKDVKNRKKTTRVTPGDKFVGHDDTGLLYAWCTDIEWEEEYLPRIMELDQDAVPVFDFRTIQVLESDSTDLAQRIEDVLDARGVADKVELFPLENEIQILCDSDELFEQIQILADQLDKDKAPEQERIFILKFKTPAEVMNVVRSLLLDGARGVRSTSSRRSNRGKKGAQPVKVDDVRMAESGDRLIVFAPAKKMEEIARLIDKLDVPDSEAGILRVFEFSRGTDVRDLSNTLVNFFPGAGVKSASRKGGKGAANMAGNDVLFIPQPASNRIVVSAPEELFPKIEDTIELIRPNEGDTVSAQVRFFDVVSEPSVIVQTVQKFMQMKHAEAIESGALPESKAKGKNQQVLVEAAGKRIMVVGPAILMDEAERVIQQLDTEEEELERIFRKVELVNAHADQMVSTIQTILSGKSGNQPARTRGGRRGKKPEAAQPAGGTFDGLTITSLPGGSAVLLVGLEEAVDEAEAWVRQIDADSTGLTETKVFRFKNMDVEKFADQIMTLFDSSGGTGQAKKKESEDSLFDFGGFADLGGPRKGKDIALVTDPYAETMVVTTTPPIMKEIENHYNLYEGEEGGAPLTPPPPQHVHLYELKYSKDAYEASSRMDDILNAVWRGDNRPYIDYISYSNILTIDCLPDDLEQVEQLIRDYVDKESQATETSRIVESIAGKPVTAEELVKWLQQQMPGVEIEIENLGPGDIDAGKYLEELAPYSQPEEISPHEKSDDVSPCVLPASATAILADLMAQVEEIKKDVEEEEKAEDKDEVSASDMRSALAADEGEEEEVRKPVVKIRYDNATGAIIVEGPSSEVGLIRDKIDDFKDDLEELDEKPEIRMYRLRYVDVRWASTVLESMYGVSRAQQQAAARAAQQAARQKQQQQKGGKAQPGQPNQQQNQGNKGKQQPTPQTKTSEMRIFPDIAQQALLIRANRSEFPAIVRLLATIDRPLTGEDANDIKTIRLEKLNAAEVENLLRELLGIGGRGGRTTARASNNPAAAAAAAQQIQQQIVQFKTDDGSESINLAEVVKISSNPATNTILVMGPENAVKIVVDAINTLEGQEIPTREPRTFVLKNADAQMIVTPLKQLFQSKGGGRRGAQGYDPNAINNPTVVVDQRRNALIIDAYTIDFPKIEPLIEQLDQVDEGGEKVVDIPLQFADAQKLASTLNRVYGKSTSRGSSKSIKIEGDAGTNTIFVSAPLELRDEIIKRIQDADKVAEKESNPITIQLAEGTPSLVARKISEALGLNSRRGARTTITADDSSRRLIVRGPSQVIEQIRQMAEDLDKAQDPVEIKVFKLKYAQAPEILEQMKKMVTDMLRNFKQSGTKMDVFTASADPRTNSLVVMGGPTTFRLVEQVLAQLDIEAAQIQPIETLVIPLKKARASDVARNINNTFKDRNRRGETQVKADSNGDVLIVRGTAEQLKEVQELINKLDEFMKEPANPLLEKKYKLVNIKADDAKSQLDIFFRDRAAAYRNAGIKNIETVKLTVSVTPETSTNQLRIMAVDENHKKVEEILADIDQEGLSSAARETVIYQMKYADPNQVNAAINAAFRKSGRVPEIDQVTSTVLWTTQSVAVTASVNNQDKIKALIDKIDIDSGQGNVREMIKLVHARASEVGNMINQTYRGSRRTNRSGQLPVQVTANDTLNMLILSGPQKEIDEAKLLISELDKKPSELSGRIVRTYKLLYADPGSTIGSINNAFPRVRGQRPEDVVTSSYAHGTSMLIVNASEENQVKVADLLKQIDVAGSERDMKIIKLEHADAQEVSRGLTQLLRSTMRSRRGDTSMQIFGDPRTNSLIVYATPEEFERVKLLVEELDVPEMISTARKMVVYPIQFADPNGVVNAINQSYRTRTRTNPKDQVTAVVEWATQSIIVTASDENQTKVADLIREIDKEGTQTRATKVIKLEYANAETLARTLSQSIERSRNRLGKQSRITADKDTNSLIIFASDKEFNQFMPLIQTLDVKPDAEKTMQIRTFKLENADAWGVEEMVTSIFGRNARNPRDRVTVSANWASNSVLIAASPENMERIEQVIAETDKKDATERTIRMVEVSFADPSMVADTLNEMFGSGGGGRGGRRGWRGAGLPQGLVISHAEGTDMLLIKANDKEFAKLEPVLKQLDSAEAEAGEVKVFTLKYVDAEEMQGILETCMSKESTGRSSRRGGRRGGSSGQMIGDVRISVVTANNQVIISGDEEGLKRAEDIIARIDVEAEDSATKPHIIVLKYAMPSMIEPTLTQLFIEGGSGRRGNSRSRNSGSSALAKPIIVADDLSNSLIVRANPADYSQIEDLVHQLDTEDAESRGGIKMITVAQGVNVEDLAVKLQELLDASADYEAQQMGGKAKPKKVTVTADVRTHSILLAGAPSMFSTAEELIRQLEEKGPLGGKTGVVIRPGNLSADDVKNLVEQVKEGDNGSSGKSNRRGGSNRNRRRR